MFEAKHSALKSVQIYLKCGKTKYATSAIFIQAQVYDRLNPFSFFLRQSQHSGFRHDLSSLVRFYHQAGTEMFSKLMLLPWPMLACKLFIAFVCTLTLKLSLTLNSILCERLNFSFRLFVRVKSTIF